MSEIPELFLIIIEVVSRKRVEQIIKPRTPQKLKPRTPEIKD